MIIYGDPTFDTSLHQFGRALRRRLAMQSPDIDQARSVLIQAGQLEQALHDQWEAEGSGAVPPSSPLARIRRATDLAAAALVEISSDAAEAGRMLERAAGEADALLAGADGPLRVKIPEGFAFYALFPEQYVAAALRWAVDHAPARPGPVLILGVRSIGTALSAVVAAALRQQGWDTRRETVRPTGHPYAREARFSSLNIGPCRYALVVDEGPGHSGSSMAAAAQALADAGVAPECIGFLPGHGGEPGSAASEAVRRWWDTVPRYTVPLSDLRWNGRSLWEMLAFHNAPGGLDGQERESLGGGEWRRYVYADPALWPAANIPFEAPKYRFTTPRGERVVWKFAGLAVVEPGGATGEEVARERLRARSAAGWTAAPLGAACGFLALPWIPGEPLTVEDASPELLAHLGRYLAAVALSGNGRDQEEATARLAEMLYWNTHESLGPEAAERTRRLPAPGREPAARYGDGRLAPCEWRRSADRHLYKTDAAGHDVDHTVVGSQSVLWDLAGALTEWKLDDHTAGPLLEAARAGGIHWEPEALLFYRMAYAAFRLGQCRMCADGAGHDPQEQARLWQAASGYQEQLAALVTVCTGEPQTGR